MGFFVAGFVREGEDGEYVENGRAGNETGRDKRKVPVEANSKPAAPTEERDGIDGSDEEEEWDGFSDDEKAAELKAVADAAVEKSAPAPAEGKKRKNKKKRTGK